VGMEPAVKPAAERTHTGKVGVLATPATFQGALYASVVERFAHGVELFQDTCPGLVQQIESGMLHGKETRRILQEALLPMLEQNIDTVVLGCTHYPFVIPLIQRIVGENVRVIDPAPAVARQTGRLLEANGMMSLSGSKGSLKFYTSGDLEALRSLLPMLLGEMGEIEKVQWLNDHVVAGLSR
ncbi:MAG TPA: aspartate/glutamate racemase family protein, partial [Anaerolineales bacterium]|nr:aspartate/glutamate racemase family protein [Anaerolineales bacterium]